MTDPVEELVDKVLPMPKCEHINSSNQSHCYLCDQTNDVVILARHKIKQALTSGLIVEVKMFEKAKKEIWNLKNFKKHMTDVVIQSLSDENASLKLKLEEAEKEIEQYKVVIENPTAHILRTWDSDRIERFAKHLLGDKLSGSCEGMTKERIVQIINTAVCEAVHQSWSDQKLVEAIAEDIHAQMRGGKK